VLPQPRFEKWSDTVDDELSQDPSLVRDFVLESEELLQRMDQDMVALESAPGDGELLNRVFRALHTIKGTSGFLGFPPVVRLSHSAEELLNGARRGEVTLDRRAMDLLLAARDQLGVMLKDISQGGLQQYQLDALLAELQEAQKPRAVTPHPEQPVKDGETPPHGLRILLAAQADSPESGQGTADKGVSSPIQTGDTLPRQTKTAEVPPAQTMRVEARKLDELVNLIGELVLERNRLVQLSRDSASGKLSHDDLDSFLAQSTARLSFITEELQSAGLKTRMVPIETVFHRFRRLVRDVAHSLQKDVQLLIRGEDTELDKTMVELIADPLVHLVRNSLDHGIEAPEVRERSGKPRQGTIRIEASQEGDQIVITVSDDGAGINSERVGQKAVQLGLVTAERLRLLSPREILEFIFLPGFSTAEKASDLSGRGVGLDVVRSNLKKLNGSIDISTHPGAGTTLLLRLPLTLAILQVLLVSVVDEVYALPLRSVVETAQINLRRVHRVEGCEVLCLRDETIPLLRLGQLFDCDSSPGFPNAESNLAAEPAGKVVILGVAEKRVALLVDQLLGQESTVVKPLGDHLHHCPSLAGASISGDGRVRLVLDPAGLIAACEKVPGAARKAFA
jgi:two-component system chemotaxis sensor kinase CheA